jgi:hypothetical protein
VTQFKFVNYVIKTIKRIIVSIYNYICIVI